MTDQYYIRRNGKISGPHTMEAVKAAAKSKKLTADDLIGTSKDGPFKKMKLPTGDSDSDSQKSQKQRTTSKDESTNPKLATCEDCGGKVSKRADECPHCGSPLRKDDSEGSFGSSYSAEYAEVDEDHLPPLPVSPRESNRRKKEKEADEEEERKKTKPKKVKQSGSAGFLVGVVCLLVVAVGIGFGGKLAIMKSNRELAEQAIKDGDYERAKQLVDSKTMDDLLKASIHERTRRIENILNQ